MSWSRVCSGRVVRFHVLVLGCDFPVLISDVKCGKPKPLFWLPHLDCIAKGVLSRFGSLSHPSARVDFQFHKRQ